MSEVEAQIVAYLRRSARRYREALGPKPPGVRAANEYDSTAAALASFFTLKECAYAIERGEHREENEG